MHISNNSVPLQELNDERLQQQNIRLFVLRLDLIHPYISGNKYFKLKHNLEEAKRQNKNTILTFGGAYSNHIIAIAAAGKEFGFNTIGIIRGEKHLPLNNYLQYAADCGMQLHYVSRDVFKQIREQQYNHTIIKQFDDYYLIPEGGSNELGVKGCMEIIKKITIDYDYVCCSSGTGATLAGIILSLEKEQQAIGFQILKGENYIKSEVEKWLTHFNVQKHNKWKVDEDYHFGGYAKTTNELLAFKNDFECIYSIPLDNVYTSKMMFGVYDLIRKGFFGKGKTIVAIHTGGVIPI